VQQRFCKDAELTRLVLEAQMKLIGKLAWFSIICLTSTAMAKGGGGGGNSGKITLSGPINIGENSCTRYTGSTQNSKGVGVNAGTVNLSGGGSGQFFSDSVCSTPTTTTTTSILGGFSFYYSDGVAESVTLTASASGFTSASLAVTVNAGYPEIALTGPTSTPTNTCTAYTLETLDSLGHPMNVSSDTTILVAATAGGFHLAADCSDRGTTQLYATIVAGTDSLPIYLSDGFAGTVEVNASADGWVTGTLSIAVGP
jgi:hypothetical protein